MKQRIYTKTEAKKIKRNNFTWSNSENFAIAIEIFEEWTLWFIFGGTNTSFAGYISLSLFHSEKVMLTFSFLEFECLARCR